MYGGKVRLVHTGVKGGKYVVVNSEKKYINSKKGGKKGGKKSGKNSGKNSGKKGKKMNSSNSFFRGG